MKSGLFERIVYNNYVCIYIYIMRNKKNFHHYTTLPI